MVTVNARLVAHAQLAKYVVTGNMSSRGKYRSYTIKFKLEVVRSALNHSKAVASRKFGVHRKLLQTWCQQESELVTTSSSRKLPPGKAKYGDIDE